MLAMPNEPVIGLIAGAGSLPREMARAARARGLHVVAIGFNGITDPRLDDAADETHWLYLGQAQELLDTLQSRGVREIVMGGKVTKQLLFSRRAELRPDALGLEILASLDLQNDDSVLLTFTEAFSRYGIELQPQAEMVPDLFATPGRLGRVQPGPGQLADLRFGWPIARAIAGVDVGQTLIVEDLAVLAVEAIEGTDAAIRRGGSLGRGAASVIKVAKPQQDPRFDLPVLGPGTLDAMIEAKVAVLAFEASCTIILERKTLVERADAHGIAILAVGSQGIEAEDMLER